MRQSTREVVLLFLSIGLPIVFCKTRTLTDSKPVQVEPLAGVPKWHLWPHLWSYKSVNISCPHKQASARRLHLQHGKSRSSSTKLALLQDFDVFIAQSKDSLADKILDDNTAWCGLERLVSGHKRTCMLSITPFQTTYVGVVPTQGIGLFKTGDRI